MSGLETTYYITAIVFMSVMMILIAALVTAIIVIRNKIIAMEKLAQDKFKKAASDVNKVVEVARAVGEVARAVKNR